MNKNSIRTYHEKVRPDIKKKHERVYAAIQSLGTATVYELADHLNTAVHNISGRLTEMSGAKEYGRPIIEGNGYRNNRYGNPCTIWRIKQYSPAEQKELFG